MLGDYPNATSLGIEFCHPDWDGRPTPATLLAATQLCAGLCLNFQLDPLTAIQTHTWVTLKCTDRGPCHKWFVENPEQLTLFRNNVKDLIGGVV